MKRSKMSRKEEPMNNVAQDFLLRPMGQEFFVPSMIGIGGYPAMSSVHSLASVMPVQTATSAHTVAAVAAAAAAAAAAAGHQAAAGEGAQQQQQHPAGQSAQRAGRDDAGNNKGGPHGCGECEFSTRDKRKLVLHKKMMHSMTAKCFRCQYCHYVINTKTALAAHENRHKKCSLCDYRSKSVPDFKHHLKDMHGQTYVPELAAASSNTKTSSSSSSSASSTTDTAKAAAAAKDRWHAALLSDHNSSSPGGSTLTFVQPSSGFATQENLHCSFCDFKSPWPNDLSRHIMDFHY